MAKKKEEETVGQSLEPVRTTLKEPKEKLLSFTVATFFSDGNLREFFEKYGYGVEWHANEVRNIPAWLAQRCINSGANLERADD